MKTETYYVKRGRRYLPAESVRGWEHADRMKVGTFRLAYAYNSGGARYEYDVTPATAPWLAAAMLARWAMEQAIQDRATAAPQQPAQFNHREQVAMSKARDILREAGLLMPTWWQHSSSWEISEAAIKAVQEYRP